MPVWGRIYDTNILTSDPYISNPVNQLLEMCAVTGGHVDKCSVNLTIQFSINSDLFHTLCIIWVGVREYLSYIRRRNLSLLEMLVIIIGVSPSLSV